MKMATSSSALFLGYKHVEAFGPDEEYESEEEVEYVTLDLGTIEPTLVPSSSSYRLIGLDSPTPYLQLSGTKLKGQHQSLLGTELLFTEARDDQQHAQGKKPLIHVATTERRIRFKEVELRPKGEASASDGPTGSTSKSSTVAKKVQTQMDHVMGTQSGSSRRGRGGRKRGGTTKKQTQSQSHSQTKEKARAEEPPTEATEPQPEASTTDPLNPTHIQMDTSEG
ncbi:hypothetical protein C8Q79DRAFT_989477 [Trametes meyenii]|nr:hypothetical protein C8Q79DRAFT_989477 [Trametes meyenii]